MKHHRKLTPSEITLAKTVFGNSIDYGQVIISAGKSVFLQPENYAMTVSNNIYMDNRYRDDYAKQDDLKLRILFIHELVHVWQYQNKIYNPLVAAAGLALKHKFNYRGKAYDYLLEKGKDLMAYGLEEQAGIIEGYFAAKLLGRPDLVAHCENKCSDGERLALLEDALTKFIENPAYGRRSSFPSLFNKPPNPPKS